MAIVRIAGAKNPLKGSIRLPGDKSISHRAALINAVSRGKATITNFAPGEDCASTLYCLGLLGVSITKEGASITLESSGELKKPDHPLDCGNSGTTMRLLSGILAGHPFKSILTGDESLRSRPMERVAKPLRLMGAEISTNDGCAPLEIKGKFPLTAIEFELPIASAQIKSSILLAGLRASGTTKVINSKNGSGAVQPRDHTERLLCRFGVDISEEIRSGEILATSINGSFNNLEARDINIPGDVSASTAFLVAAAGLPGSKLQFENVGLNPTRRAIFDFFLKLGFRLTFSDQNEEGEEPFGNLKISSDVKPQLPNERLVLKGPQIAELIDEIPAIAVLGTTLPAGLEVREASELRHKETDRIAAVVSNLERMGAMVNEFDDGFSVEYSKLKSAEIDTFGDHRIAMAFAAAACLAEGTSVIRDAGCVSVSYPSFFEDLGKLR